MEKNMFNMTGLKSVRISVLFAFLSIFALNVYAQDGNKIVKAVQDKYNSAKDISADVKQVSGDKAGFNGKVYFKKGNMFRAEFNNTVLVSDGENTWNYNKKENKVVIDRFDTSNPVSINSIINEYPSKSDINASAEGDKTVLTFTPKKGTGLNFHEVKLWVNSNNLVDRVQVKQHSGNTTELQISNYKLNQGTADSQFSFNPPKGATVVDLR
jgi:outer membrane lipoprotein carrier protein